MARPLLKPASNVLSKWPAFRLLANRKQHSHNPKGDEGDVEQRIEDVIKGIVVRRSAPDWLPFRPGSSYWVPPRYPHGVAVLAKKVANTLTRDEIVSLTAPPPRPSFPHGPSSKVVEETKSTNMTESRDQDEN